MKPQKINMPEMFPKEKIKKTSELEICMNCRKFWDCILLDTTLRCLYWEKGELIEPQEKK